jgi:hypothetical protein
LTAVRNVKTCLGVLLLVWLGAGELSAQNTIRGRVVDENDKPVPNIQVLLHRVTKSGGGGVATDTSDARGAFTLTAPPETDSSAVYFVAVQEGGELFMGEMQRLPFPDTLEYIIEAGDEPVQLGESAPVPTAPEDRRAGLYVVMAGALLLASLFFLAMRRRPPEHRRVLVQLAQLPEDDQSDAVARRRRQLYARLKRDA